MALIENQTTYAYAPPRKMLVGIRISALLEMALAIFVLIAGDVLLFDRENYWSSNPSPYLFVVLFIACKYGTKEALVATFVTSVAVLSHNIPAQAVTQDAYDYVFTLLHVPLLCLVLSVVFGELRQMHIFERNKLETDLQESLMREKHIGESYERVKDIKNRLEVQVAGQMRSAISVYRAARNLESLIGMEVMKGIEELVNATLSPEKFSIYTLHKDGLHVTLTHGWNEDDHFKRRFNVDASLYHAVINRQSIVCVMSADQEKILDSQGIIAGPLIDRQSGEVFGMIKIEMMSFSSLHLTNIQTFSAICDWAGMALLNARKYQLSKSASIVNPEHSLFTQNYFSRHMEYLKSLARRVGFDVTMINLTLNNPMQFSKEMRVRIAQSISDAVERVLRSVDLAFDTSEGDDCYSIILPTTNAEGAQVVLDKIRKVFAEEVTMVTENVNFTFSVQTIYEKNTD